MRMRSPQALLVVQVLAEEALDDEESETLEKVEPDAIDVVRIGLVRYRRSRLMRWEKGHRQSPRAPGRECKVRESTPLLQCEFHNHGN